MILKQSILASALMLAAPLFAQEAKPVEYNLSFCAKQGLGATHAILAADRKTLDFLYYRNGDAVVRDDDKDGSHLIFKLDKFELSKEDGEYKLHGSIAGVPEDGKPDIKHVYTISGSTHGDRAGFLVFVDNQLFFVLYGYAGDVDGLIKLDISVEGPVCQAFRQTEPDELPSAVEKWLKDAK